MKKFKTMICALAVALTGFAAQAQDQVNFVLDIDDASHVSVQVNYQPYEVQTGANSISVTAYTSVSVKGVSPYEVKSVTDENGTPAGNLYSGEWNIYPSTSEEGKTFTLVTANPDDARSASFTVNVDEASMVTMMRINGYKNIALENGANTVKIDPSNTSDCTFSISNNYAVSNTPLYKLTVNGVEKQPTYSSYEIVVSAGDVVDITAKIPEVPAVCSFTFSEGAEGCISSVLVNNQPAEIVNGKLEAKTGQQLLINFNISDYAIESFSVNGTQNSVYSSFNYTVMGDTEFAIQARKYATVSATVKVSDPTAVTLYRGYSYQNDVIALSGTETVIELSENNSMISWAAANGCTINGVTVNGQAYSSYNNDYTVKNGDVIEIDAGKIVMDKKAIVWINNRSLATTYFSFQGSDRSQIEIATGYNEIEFYSAMTPFMLSWYAPEITAAAVYVNNEARTPMYSGEPSNLTFDLPLQDGDVVKVFYNETPVECSVDFNIADGVDADVVADRIVAVDPAASYSCLNGTEIAITVGEGHVVKVNGTEIDPVEGVYTATVAEPSTSIEIAKDSETSISEINAAANGSETVYDLAGRRVAKAGRGLYIINGKKVIR